MDIAARNAVPEPLPGAQLFTLLHAERILGESAHLKDSSSGKTSEIYNFNSAFVAEKNDPHPKRPGTIYFMFENYQNPDSAKAIYAFIKTGNQDHGIEVLNDLGYEAYFHTDKQNFYFMLVRKENKMIRLKVNKITANTSKDEFNIVCREITAAM